MKSSLRPLSKVALTGIALLAAAGVAHAHFLWLKTDAADGKTNAVLFFGENADDEAYHLPEALADTKIWHRTPRGDRIELSSEKTETDDRIGLMAKLPSNKPCAIEATRQYGVYGDFLLTYYAKHVHAASRQQLAEVGPSPELMLDVVPQPVDDGIELIVLWDGEPRADANVTVTIGDGDAEELKTDEQGKVVVKPERAGLIAVLANFYDRTQSGEMDGKPYTSAAHYATLTFPWSQDSKVESPEPEQTSGTLSMPPLPEPLTSFGAVVADGSLYVYSGHTGTEHEHSAANLSQHFRRVSLDGGEWEELPIETPLQGLALVSHGGKIYRVGGMNARNATAEDEEDLHSTDEFAEFDPATNEWTALAPLPDARSSHNAVVIGTRLYVVGGWTLAGSRSGEWLDHSLVYDFNNSGAGWQRLPEQSFQRRALAAGHWQGKLVALGGMDEDRKVSQRVDVLDPQSGEWSQGPDLPGRRMAGFGASAWNLDGRLYVSSLDGRLYRLSGDGSEWEEVARLAKPRFFHQLVPAGDAALLAVGGASRKEHLADIERIDVSSSTAASRPSTTTEADAGTTRRAVKPST